MSRMTQISNPKRYQAKIMHWFACPAVDFVVVWAVLHGGQQFTEAADGAAGDVPAGQVLLPHEPAPL